MTFSDLETTRWFVDRKAEQIAAHDGEALFAAATACCVALPPGRVTLLTTSPEGTALAGAIAAVRQDPTVWHRMNWADRERADGQVAVVEMVQLGEGLRAALRDVYPDAIFLDRPAATAGRDGSRLSRAA